MDRPNHEEAAILALAFRAGLFGRGFGVQPANANIDRGQGTDLFIVRDRFFLRVDLTEGIPALRSKVRRSIDFARQGRQWVKIIYVQKEQTIGVVADSCFQRSYDAFVRGRTMEVIALPQACPDHGNDCSLAPKLWELSTYLNAQLSRGQARNFQMDFAQPPF